MRHRKKCSDRRSKHVTKRISALSAAILLWIAFVLPVAAADSLLTPVNQPPVELTAAQNGNWELQYWGNEGRYAYRFLGEENGRYGLQTDDDAFSFEIETTVRLRTLVSVHQNTISTSVPTMEAVVKNGASLVNTAPLGAVGSMTVIAEDGTIYGPFPCVTDGAPVVNGVTQENLLWVADCGEQVLPPGRYTVEDSSPESQFVANDLPVMLAKVVDDAAWQGYLAVSGAEGNYQGRYEAAVFNDAGNPIAGPFVLAVADSGNRVEIACHLADMPFAMKLDKTAGEDSLEASATISVLPEQGIGELSLALVFNRVKGDWILSGDGTITTTRNGEQQTTAWKVVGNMKGKDMPSFYFPMPIAGMGGVGNIPGPGSDAQAAVGVIAPGLIGLLATLLAGGKPSGGAPVVEMPVPIEPIAPVPDAPSPTQAVPPTPSPTPTAPTMPDTPIEPPVIAPPASPVIPPSVNEPPVIDTPIIPDTLPDSSGPKNPFDSIFPGKPEGIEVPDIPGIPEGTDIPQIPELPTEPSLPNDESPFGRIFPDKPVAPVEPVEPVSPFDRLFPDAPPPEPQAEPFMGFWKRPVSPESGVPDTTGASDLLKLIQEKAAKRQILSKLEGLLQSKEASASGEEATGFAAIREKIFGLSEDVRFSRKSSSQINSEVQALQTVMAPSGDIDLSTAISKAVEQAADITGASDMSDVGLQIANDVASGGLSEVGFIGDDLMVTAVMGVETSDVLSEAASTVRVLYADNVTEKLKEQGIEVLGGMYKPRTDLPEQLLESVMKGPRRL